MLMWSYAQLKLKSSIIKRKERIDIRGIRAISTIRSNINKERSKEREPEKIVGRKSAKKYVFG